VSDYQTGWAHALEAVRKMLISNGQPGLASDLLNLSLPLPFPPSPAPREEPMEYQPNAVENLRAGLNADGTAPREEPCPDLVECHKCAVIYDHARLGGCPYCVGGTGKRKGEG
jgi:hypothetical protein